MDVTGHPARRYPISLVDVVELLVDDPDGIVYNKLVYRVVVLHVWVNREIHASNSSEKYMGMDKTFVVGQFELLVCSKTVVDSGFGSRKGEIISSSVFIKTCQLIYT